MLQWPDARLALNGKASFLFFLRQRLAENTPYRHQFQLRVGVTENAADLFAQGSAEQLQSTLCPSFNQNENLHAACETLELLICRIIHDK